MTSQLTAMGPDIITMPPAQRRPGPLATLLILALAWGADHDLYSQPTAWDWGRAVDSGEEKVRDIVVDNTNNWVYGVGTYSDAGPFGLPATAGNTDAFLVKLNADGTLLWSRRIGGNSEDHGNGIALLPNGNIVITGGFQGALTASSNAAISITAASLGNSDMFLACYSATGDLLWLRSGGGSQEDMGWSVAANTSGIFVLGAGRGVLSFDQASTTLPTSNGDEVFLVNYPLTGGLPQWTITGGGINDDSATSIAADALGVVLTGTIRSDLLTWRSASGTAIGNASCTNNVENPFVARVANSGSVQWTQLIDAPSNQTNAVNTVVVENGRVFIGGQISQGAIFPMLGTINHGTSEEMAYVAALDAQNGNGLWISTAVSPEDDGAIIRDLAIGANGQIYVVGSFETALTNEDGNILIGTQGRELFVARYSATGVLAWWRGESAAGGEYPSAIGVLAGNSSIIGGTYTGDLTLSPLTFAGSGNANAFIGRLEPDTWGSTAVPPSRWKHLGARCNSASSIDLLSRLQGHVDRTGGPVNITGNENVIGPPDGLGANFNAGGSSLMMDMGDTVLAGSSINLTLRLANAGMPSRVNLQFSLDGTNWVALGNSPQVTNSTYAQLTITAPIAHRYMRSSLPASAPNAAILLDAITYLTGTVTGGTWSGPGVTPSGSFNPSGLEGYIPITYSVTIGTIVSSTTRIILVTPPPSGNIVGPVILCPGNNGTQLTVQGMNAWESVVNWLSTSDGVNWTTHAQSVDSFTTPPLSTSTQFVARLHTKGCASSPSNTHEVIVTDTEPPAFTNCPGAILVEALAGQCHHTYTFPELLSTDDCDIDPVQGYQTQVLMQDSIGPLNATGLVTIDLPVGTHMIREIHTDDSGNTATCTWSVTVADAEPPVITCSPIGPLTLSQGYCGVLMPSTPIVAMDNCSIDSIWQVAGPEIGDTLWYSASPYETTWSAVDLAGNTSQCTQSITLVDLDAPDVTCPIYDHIEYFLDASGQIAFPDLRDSLTVTDCSSWSNTMWPPAGMIFDKDTVVLMTMDIEDIHGNHLDNDHFIWIRDTISPTITCPLDVVVPAVPGACNAAASFSATTSDNSSAPPAISYSIEPGTSFPIGVTSVTVSAVDASGNSSSCNFSVTVTPAIVDVQWAVGSICANSAPILPSIATPPGGVFSDATQAGTIDPSTGSFNPALATPGPHTLGYVFNAGGCPSHDWFTITVEPSTNAGSSGSLSVCSANGTASLFNALGGSPQPGGSWSGPSPVSGGNYVATTMAPGQYAYTVPGTLFCASATATVTVNETIAELWFADQDSDGLGDPAISQMACIQPTGYVSNNTDTCPFGPNPGTACDDGDPQTGNDVVNGLCICQGEVIDCAGVTGGSAILDNCGTCVGGSTGNTACTQDCNGDFGGTAFLDNCGTCVGGSTGNTACLQDCNGDFGGTAFLDNCGTCVGGNTGLTACPQDCNGDFGGTAFLDNCGTCVGGNTGEVACLQDCNGDFGGTAFLDNCGTCVGGNTGNTACTQDCAGVWGGTELPGTTCDDGDANTINDVWDANCTCVGSSATFDCLGVANGNAMPGTACDDNDPSTSNDIWTSDCTCSGSSVGCTSDAGPDQSVCGNTTLLAASGTGAWTPTPGIIFSDLSSPTSTVLSLASGTYALQWTVTLGSCVAVDSMVVNFISMEDAAFNYNDNAFCQNATPPTPWAASLAGNYSSNPSGLSIDPTDGTIAPSQSEPGTYWVYHTIDGPCPSQDSTQVTIHGTASADWTPPSALCAGEQQYIVLADLITGPTGGTWSGPHVENGIFTPDVSGEFPISYAVTEGSCTSTTTHIIVVLDIPAANAGNDLSTCTSSIQLQAQPTTESGSWQLPDGLSVTSTSVPNATVTSTTTGTYTLTWTVSNEACSASDLVEVTFLDPGTGVWVDAGPDQVIEQFALITLSATATEGAELQWTILQGTGTLQNANMPEATWEGTSTGDHVAMITASINDCASVSDTVRITVLDLFIPAGFSPNGDGVNDLFEITGLSAYSQRALKVFNRWGQEVYSSSSYTNDWDGRAENGQDLSDGTYFYILNLGGPNAYNGPVIIKR